MGVSICLKISVTKVTGRKILVVELRGCIGRFASCQDREYFLHGSAWVHSSPTLRVPPYELRTGLGESAR